MKDIYSRFMKEHDREKVHLNFLNDAINRIIREGFNPDDFGILKNALGYFETEIRDHCLREEVSIYPVLNSVASSNDIYEMKYEHEKIDLYLVQLKKILEDIELSNPTDSLLVKLKVDTKSFVHLLLNHINKEDEYFLLMAKKTLSDKDLNQLFRMHKEKL